VIKNTFDVDEAMIFTTLQQPRESGYNNALFQIKFQVKDSKVNALFDSGSQCNLIYESSVNELHRETHDIVQPVDARNGHILTQAFFNLTRLVEIGRVITLGL
jgi:hypothetical protein